MKLLTLFDGTGQGVVNEEVLSLTLIRRCCGCGLGLGLGNCRKSLIQLCSFVSFPLGTRVQRSLPAEY